MILSIEHRQMFEDVVIAAQRLLALHSSGTVVPGIVDQDLAVMEADADDKVVALYPAHHGLHLLVSAPQEVVVRTADLPPAWELSVEVREASVVPGVGLRPVRVDGGDQMDLGFLQQPPGGLVIVAALTEVTTESWLILYSQHQQLSSEKYLKQ